FCRACLHAWQSSVLIELYTLSLHDALPILTGVYRRDMMEPMAEALMRLGRKRGAIIHGAGGLDELSLAGINELIVFDEEGMRKIDRKSTRLNSSHVKISYAVFCLKKKK